MHRLIDTGTSHREWARQSYDGARDRSDRIIRWTTIILSGIGWAWIVAQIIVESGQ